MIALLYTFYDMSIHVTTTECESVGLKIGKTSGTKTACGRECNWQR